jgi:hypothetical protein
MERYSKWPGLRTSPSRLTDRDFFSVREGGREFPRYGQPGLRSYLRLRTKRRRALAVI